MRTGRIGRAAALRALWEVARGVRRPGAPGVAERLRALPRMAALTLGGRYPGLTRGRLLMLALAAAYLVSPVDLVPELVVPLLGFGDDALVLTWLAGAVLADTEEFLAWEASRKAGPVGQERPTPAVVRGEVLRS